MMDVATVLGFIIGGLFSAMLIFGFATGAMPAIRYGTFDRDEQPVRYWITAAANAFGALIGWYMALWP